MNAARLTFKNAVNSAVFMILGLLLCIVPVRAALGGDNGSTLRDLAYLDLARGGGGGATGQSADSLQKIIKSAKTDIRFLSGLHSSLSRDANYFDSQLDQREELLLSIRQLQKDATHVDKARRENAGDRLARSEKALAIVNDEIERLEQFNGSGVFDRSDVLRKLKAEVKGLESHKEKLENRLYNSSGMSGAIGHAAIRGLAGKDGFLVFRDVQPNSLMEGLTAGVTYRAMSVVGDLLQDTIQAEGTELWNTVVGGSFRAVKDAVKNSWFWLFHGGDHPLTPEKLEMWKAEVLQVILEGLEKRARESQKEQSSGRDARMRALFDAAGDQQKDGQQGDAAQLAREEDPTWVRIAQGYAGDLERLAMRIEAHKPFYSPKSDNEEERFYLSEKADIIALATRLQDTLRLIKDNILLPSGTFKDLASGDVKLFLLQLSKELKERFDLLIKTVRGYHGLSAGKKSEVSSSSSSSTASSSSYNSRRPMYEPY